MSGPRHCRAYRHLKVLNMLQKPSISRERPFQRNSSHSVMAWQRFGRVRLKVGSLDSRHERCLPVWLFGGFVGIRSDRCAQEPLLLHRVTDGQTPVKLWTRFLAATFLAALSPAQ